MANFAHLILIAVLGGAAITLQGQFMGLMDQVIGTKESVFITYAGGGLLITILIDHFGLLGAAVRPLDLSRSLGLIVLLIAVWLIVR